MSRLEACRFGSNLAGMTQLTIAVPPELQLLIDARLADGAYVDAGDYLRDLLRRDQRVEHRRAELRAAIAQGLASGVVDQDPREIIAELIAEDPDLRD
jgi:antitoxin ParD1/3/4